MRGNKTNSNSGAVGDARGVVQNVCPVQDRELITDGSDNASWAVLSDDTDNLTTDPTHVLGTVSFEFDKVDGDGNTKFAGIVRDDLNLDLSRFTMTDKVEALFSIPDTTNVAAAYLRLGTDASNYNQWKLADGDITQAVWQELSKKLDACEFAVVGNGWNPAVVKYAAFVVEFDAEGNALADMLLDHILVKSVQPAS